MEENLNGYDVVCTLGSGGWGNVILCKRKHDNLPVAVKVMQKTKVCHSDWSIDSIRREREILAVLPKSPWFPQLIFAENARNSLYLGMTFAQGGDLHDLQELVGVFTEDQIKFYIAEILFGLNILHRMRIIHRDLKKSNVLVDKRGHLMIADFGMSKRTSPKERRYSNCGTVINVSLYV